MQMTPSSYVKLSFVSSAKQIHVPNALLILLEKYADNRLIKPVIIEKYARIVCEFDYLSDDKKCS